MDWYQGPGDRGRALQFSVFGAVCAAVGAGSQLAGVAAWPWIVYALALFVLSQALVKWIGYAWRSCRQCGYSTHDWLGRKP